MKQLIAGKLNLDTHYSLLEQGDLVYLMNGDIEGIDNSNHGMLVQNQLSNELCALFPTGFTFINGIQLNNFQFAVFFVNGGTSKIGLLDAKTCTYTDIITSTCLGFNPNNPIRGVYKHLNKTNERVVYWVDGLNPNRYLNIDQALLGNYPKVALNSDCNDCEVEYSNELDCNKIRINKSFNPPCVTVKPNKTGTLATGTYQVAIAYSEDGIVLTDFFFSDPVKAFSGRENIGFDITIDCVGGEIPFKFFTLVLITQTKEGSLIPYSNGEYNIGTKRITINTLTNATAVSTSNVTLKKTIYDVSQHIVSNSETLLVGKHQSIENVDYQPLANQIEVFWVERKVPSKYAHLFPTFMRDEVYDFAIEWQDELGRNRGVFHIPGRLKDNDFQITFGTKTFNEGDPASKDFFHIYEDDDPCAPMPQQIWEIENTATVLESFAVDCPDCEDDFVISKKGKMGYYECKDLTYPNESKWGENACNPIRRHRMPSHNLSHIHDNAFCETLTFPIEQYDDNGNLITPLPTYEERFYRDSPCVNILGIELDNIQLPTGVTPQAGWTYRILVSSREGNKSVLHKGLVYNVMKEIVRSDEDLGFDPDPITVMYPNYPYNDLKPDRYLSTVQTNESSVVPANHIAPNNYYKTRFTYHSPDVSFRETQGEFGSELKFYIEQFGKVKGEFDECYRHPKVALGATEPDVKTSWPYAQQFNSAAHYFEYQDLDTSDWKGKQRRRIDASQWLLPIKQFVNDNQRFNNEKRETSYYIELENYEVPNPKVEDTTRFTIGDTLSRKINFCSTVQIGSTSYDVQASAYYTGVKLPQPNQYGQNEQIRYVPVEACFRKADQETISNQMFFGGDIYISKHSVFRKMPLFKEWLYDVPYNTEYNYRDQKNVYYPVYWFDNLTQANDLFRLSNWNQDAGEFDADHGYFYLWVTGNPYFWCESEFIGDYREFDTTPNSRFYPKVDFNDIARLDTVSLQPTFLYDFSLLNTHIENRVLSGDTKSDAEFIVSFSQKNDLQGAGDNWLKFLPLNYTILPQIYGEFTGLHYVDQYSVMFAFENEILFSQEDYTLQSEQGNNIFLGQGDIFSRRLRRMSNENTGYTGCVDPLSFVNTRYGTFFFDRYRSNFFLWDGQLKNLNGLRSWTNKYAADVNPGYKDSLISVFDNFTDNVYFTDKINQWTISYKAKREAFISFHSFVPTFYLTLPNTFISTNSNGFWKHNKEGHYQTYFGVQYDFEIGYAHFTPEHSELQDIQIWTEFIKYLDYMNPIYNKDKFFDKIMVYNNQGSTGLIDLFVKDRNNPNHTTIQNSELTPTIAEVSNMSDSLYRINKFENMHRGEGFPVISLQSNGMYYTPLNIIDKAPIDRDSIKGRWFKVHLISRLNNDHKILAQLAYPLLDPLKR